MPKINTVSYQNPSDEAFVLQIQLLNKGGIVTSYGFNTISSPIQAGVPYQPTFREQLVDLPVPGLPIEADSIAIRTGGQGGDGKIVLNHEQNIQLLPETTVDVNITQWHSFAIKMKTLSPLLVAIAIGAALYFLVKRRK